MLRATMASLQADAGESARSRIAWRLLPFLFLLYVANYLDRTNIAYATLGMKGDLGLSDSVFGTASGIFFIGYFALQIPGALLVERWSARLLLATTLITWGALTTLTGFVHTPHGALLRAIFVRRSRSRIFPRRDCLSFALVRLSGSGQSDGTVSCRRFRLLTFSADLLPA